MRKLVYLAFAIFAATAFGQPRPHVPSHLLVGFKPGVPDSQVDAVVQGIQGRGHEQIPGTNVHTVSLPANANENASANALQNRPEVDFVEFDQIVPVSAMTPNDPNYQYQSLGQLSAPQAWSTTTGSSSVVIAIIDTGVDGTHPDLAAKM